VKIRKRQLGPRNRARKGKGFVVDVKSTRKSDGEKKKGKKKQRKSIEVVATQPGRRTSGVTKGHRCEKSGLSGGKTRLRRDVRVEGKKARDNRSQRPVPTGKVLWRGGPKKHEKTSAGATGTSVLVPTG